MESGGPGWRRLAGVQDENLPMDADNYFPNFSRFYITFYLIWSS
jgi:hypothetical protein